MAETAISIEPARRRDLAFGLALLTAIGGMIAFYNQKIGTYDRGYEARNRENDALRDDVKQLREWMLNCRSKQ